MPEPWVVNASPLIILSRIGRLDFLESLAPTVSVPDAVIAEVIPFPYRFSLFKADKING